MKTLLTILVLLMPTVSFAAIAHLQSPVAGADCGTATTCALAYGSNTTAGSLLVSVCRYGTAGGRTITITDTALNTWTSNTFYVTQVTDGHTQGLSYAPNSIGGADTVTCTVSGAGTIMRTGISEFSGVKTTSPLDKIASTTGNGTTPASGSITPSADGSLIFAFEGNGSGVNITAGTDFTLGTRVPNSTGARVATEWYIQPTATGHDGTFGVSQNNWSAGIASFLPAGGAAAPAVDSSFINTFEE